MNQVYISNNLKKFQTQNNILSVPFEQADQYLQLLRSDYFNKIVINLPNNLNDKQLKFMMHLSRVLKKNGLINIQNKKDSQQAVKFTNLAKKIGLFEYPDSQQNLSFSKTKPQEKQVKTQQNKKLSIGFKSLVQEQIDEQDLMKNQNISIQKSKPENCAEKPRACANCNCGRKNNQTPVISKEKLVESVNQGNPVSGCGKCYLGDSFRCGSCPYKGLPAFKPGDKLKLMDEGQVVVQTGEVKVQSGKVKIQL